MYQENFQMQSILSYYRNKKVHTLKPPLPIYVTSDKKLLLNVRKLFFLSLKRPSLRRNNNINAMGADATMYSLKERHMEREREQPWESYLVSRSGGGGGRLAGHICSRLLPVRGFEGGVAFPNGGPPSVIGWGENERGQRWEMHSGNSILSIDASNGGSDEMGKLDYSTVSRMSQSSKCSISAHGLTVTDFFFSSQGRVLNQSVG